MNYSITEERDCQLLVNNCVWSDDDHYPLTDTEWDELVTTGTVITDDHSTYYLTDRLDDLD